MRDSIILCFISDTALFVKVAHSIELGSAPKKRRDIYLALRENVFPLPALAKYPKLSIFFGKIHT